MTFVILNSSRDLRDLEPLYDRDLEQVSNLTGPVHDLQTPVHDLQTPLSLILRLLFSRRP